MTEYRGKRLLSREEKLKWGDGEWVEEPDFVEFEYRGYLCEIKRMIDFQGHLNGYVTIPPEHPWFGKLYDNIKAEVHGGLTYCAEGLRREGLYKIGFDCAHSGDVCPMLERGFQGLREETLRKFPWISSDSSLFSPTYKNIAFVVEECKKLVDQAIEAALNKKEKEKIT